MEEHSYVFRKDNYYPIIQIILKKGNISFRADALLDSGASISVFQGSIADYLGIDIEKGVKKLFQGVGGKIVGYIHELKVIVDDVEFPCKIAFSDELTTSLNLLGRDNFFNYFLITFNEGERKVILDPKKY